MLNGQKGWIVSAQGGVMPHYTNEGTYSQNGIDLADKAKESLNTVSESVGEPLTKAQVLTVAGAFLA